MVTRVVYSETYDLSTTKDKLGLIAVRTPTTGAIRNLYDGLWKNHKYVRIVSCNIGLACASVLPADPLGVGVDAGDIAPQDLFNPILYKTVSNDSFESFLTRMYSISTPSAGVEPTVPVTVGDFDPYTSSSGWDEWHWYYLQLASKGWKKAMPQSGFIMRNVRPFVYPLLNTVGNLLIPSSSSSMNTIPGQAANNNITNNSTGAATFRGRAQPMGRLPTKYVAPNTSQASNNSLPTTYVAAILTPPAKLHVLYYRLRVSWVIEFSNVVSNAEQATNAEMESLGAVYGSDFTFPETVAKSVRNTDSVTTIAVNAEKVM